MRLRFLLLVLCLFYTPAPVFADSQPAAVEKLDTISDEVFQMVKNQRYEEAKNLLKTFSEEFNGISHANIPFTLDEVRIVSLSRDEAMEAAASPTMDYQERLNRITKFRLVMDALATSHEPLWAEMEDEVMGAFSLAKKAALEGNTVDYRYNLNTFLSYYLMIHPSIKIDIPADSIQKLDARVEFFERYNPSVPAGGEEREELEALGKGLQDIFDGIEEDEADPSLWWVIISTGSIIILTLSYVGWRKFQGDRETERKRSQEHKN